MSPDVRLDEAGVRNEEQETSPQRRQVHEDPETVVTEQETTLDNAGSQNQEIVESKVDSKQKTTQENIQENTLDNTQGIIPGDSQNNDTHHAKQKLGLVPYVHHTNALFNSSIIDKLKEILRQ